MIKIERIQFTYFDNMLIAYFADWRRKNEKLHAIVVYRDGNSIAHKKILLGAITEYHYSEISEEEAYALDASIVDEAYKQRKLLLREGLFSILGKDPSATLFPEIEADAFAQPQMQYIEAQTVHVMMKAIIPDMIASEKDQNKKGMWSQIGLVADAYLDYCRDELFLWAKEIALPEILSHLPETQHASITCLFQTIEEHSSLWEDFIRVMLQPLSTFENASFLRDREDMQKMTHQLRIVPSSEE